MKIKEALVALSLGQTINSANAAASITPTEKEGEKRADVTTVRNGRLDVMDVKISRLQQLYAQHDFGKGEHPKVAQLKAEQSEPEAKPATKAK